MKYDLHIHTSCSDGKYSKLDLLKYLNGLNYEYVSFADHNYIIRNIRKNNELKLLML